MHDGATTRPPQSRRNSNGTKRRKFARGSQVGNLEATETTAGATGLTGSSRLTVAPSGAINVACEESILRDESTPKSGALDLRQGATEMTRPGRPRDARMAPVEMLTMPLGPSASQAMLDEPECTVTVPVAHSFECDDVTPVIATLPAATAPRDSARRDSARRDSARRDSARRDSARGHRARERRRTS